MAQIPLRDFGRTGVKISALGLGGHHLGDAADLETAKRIVAEAVDGGITFFDNCWEYHRGKSEDWLGQGLKGRRDGVFLMTKVCTHGRGKELAMRMLEESLNRLQTDHLDLWQIHGVSFENDPELFIRPDGAAEALELAKRQGKTRFVGFSGHKLPSIHLALLGTGFPFDSVQMPLNPFDASFHSFQNEVLPELNRRSIAALGMKPLSGAGDAVNAGWLTAEEALRFAMSLPVSTTISGAEKIEVLRQNLKVAQNFQPMTEEERSALIARVRVAALDGRFELYKTTLKFDNPEARMAHQFPIDPTQKEVKEMLESTKNTGKPFPKLQPQ